MVFSSRVLLPLSWRPPSIGSASWVNTELCLCCDSTSYTSRNTALAHRSLLQYGPNFTLFPSSCHNTDTVWPEKCTQICNNKNFLRAVQCSGQFVHWQECPLVVYLPCFRDCGGLLCSAWHLCQPGFGHCRTGWASGKAKYWVKGGGLDIVNGFFCAVVISVLTILCI